MRLWRKLVCRLRGHDNVLVVNETFGPLVFCRRCCPKVFSIIHWNVIVEADGTISANSWLDRGRSETVRNLLDEAASYEKEAAVGGG